MTGSATTETQYGTPERIGERLGHAFLIALLVYLALGLAGFLR
ncbi:hypothetical protein OCAR_6179 [Afipia carboxidovorans OM5]|uniref:Uncharacterized protein n=1 Tax=Afipia carboxidovorans (strain ATCC 49405 / DSM 1227 / KCTC 32145 / OM5) TaxID=504832 RepID=B6JEM8_AFIC5|nr:hypothetical protein [Afipia carboxidovorans]ACI93293.1 hypothetical protein OCAR_6179 [Afipia carboxidovorans OM5]AEI06564.1 hypothetical protein OCA5_c18510 [Afipia carboxidovorans OM5]